MAEVILGRAGRIVVASPLCAKTGRPTTQRVVLRGSAMPAWVNLLFVFSFIGMLVAGAATSRRYVVSIPFSHDAHDRWRRGRRAAWAIGGLGGAAVAFAAVHGAGYSAVLTLGGVALAVVGVVVGLVNGSEGNVGVGLTRDNDLVLRRVHPAFAASLTAAGTERRPLASGG